MALSRDSIILLMIFLFYYCLYVALVPPFENPDETYHHENTFIVPPYEFDYTGDGNLFYYFQKNVGQALGLSQVKFTLVGNNSFKYFTDSYRFKHPKYFVSETGILKFRLLNLLYILPCIFVFLLYRANAKYFAMALALPGFAWFMTCINPDTLSIAIAMIVFCVIERQRFFLYLVLVFCFLFLDRTIILLIISIIAADIYIAVFQKNKFLSVFFWVLFGLFLYLSNDFIKENILSVDRDFRAIKSFVTMTFSFYGLLGPMAIKATYIEYAVFLLLVFLGMKNAFTTKSLDKKAIKEKTIMLFYGVIWMYVLFLAPTIDHGRYFYPILFIIIKSFWDSYPISYNKILLIGFVTNTMMFIKLLIVY